MIAYEQITDRRELKRLRVVADRVLRRRREMNAHLAELEKSKDTAADKHQAETAPKQAKLKDTEDAIIAPVVDRLDAEPTLEALRKRLCEEIEQHNVDLQAELDDINRRIALVRKELNTLEIPNRDVIESRLVTLGDPKKVRQHNALTWIADHISPLRKHINKQLEIVESNEELAKQWRLVEGQDYCDRWKAQWNATGELLNDVIDGLRNDATTIRNELIEG